MIVPYFRGYGTTTFLSAATPRNVDQAAFALDILALMDALGIQEAILAGYDWGSRTGDIIAALWPQRCTALVSVTGYLITNLAAKASRCLPQRRTTGGTSTTSAPSAACSASASTATSSASSSGSSTRRPGTSRPATYDCKPRPRSTIPTTFPIVIGNYRWRLGLAPAEPEYAAIEKRPAAGPGHRGADDHHRRRSTTRSPRPGTGRPTGPSSPASTTTGSLTSATTCRRKTRAASPRPSSTPATSSRLASAAHRSASRRVSARGARSPTPTARASGPAAAEAGACRDGWPVPRPRPASRRRAAGRH